MKTVKDITTQEFNRLLVFRNSKLRTRANKILWECLCDCGNICLVTTGDLNSRHTRSCGCLQRERSADKCGKKHPMYGKMNGVDHPNWKGGVTSKNEQIRKSTAYKDWRKAVYKRDWHTCQKCRTYGGKLNAHHIEAFNTNPELRTEINNGITFCKECHKNFHHQYGYGDNTKEQLEIFIYGDN